MPTQQRIHTDRSTETSLRRTLLTNAATSGVGGIVAVAAGGRVDEMLGTGHPGWVRVVGAGLVAFAAIVVGAASASRDRLVRTTPAISVGDASWVFGTAATIALGWYSNRGAVVMAVVATMVGGFGVAQATLVRRMGRPARPRPTAGDGHTTASASPTGVS